MKRDAVLPVDRLLAGYNLVLVGVWLAVLPSAAYAPAIVAAHGAGLMLPGLCCDGPRPHQRA